MNCFDECWRKLAMCNYCFSFWFRNTCVPVCFNFIALFNFVHQHWCILTDWTNGRNYWKTTTQSKQSLIYLFSKYWTIHCVMVHTSHNSWEKCACYLCSFLPIFPSLLLFSPFWEFGQRRTSVYCRHLYCIHACMHAIYVHCEWLHNEPLCGCITRRHIIFQE